MKRRTHQGMKVKSSKVLTNKSHCATEKDNKKPLITACGSAASPLRANRRPPRRRRAASGITISGLRFASFAPAHVALRAACGRLPGQRPLARVRASGFCFSTRYQPLVTRYTCGAKPAIHDFAKKASSVAVTG